MGILTLTGQVMLAQPNLQSQQTCCSSSLFLLIFEQNSRNCSVLTAVQISTIRLYQFFIMCRFNPPETRCPNSPSVFIPANRAAPANGLQTAAPHFKIKVQQAGAVCGGPLRMGPVYVCLGSCVCVREQCVDQVCVGEQCVCLGSSVWRCSVLGVLMLIAFPHHLLLFYCILFVPLLH